MESDWSAGNHVNWGAIESCELTTALSHYLRHHHSILAWDHKPIDPARTLSMIIILYFLLLFIFILFYEYQ